MANFFDEITGNVPAPKKFVDNSLEERYLTEEDKNRQKVARLLESASPTLIMGLDINMMGKTALKILASDYAREEFQRMEDFFNQAKPDYTILAIKMYRSSFTRANLNSAGGVRSFLNHIAYTNQKLEDVLINKVGKNHTWSAVKYGHAPFKGIDNWQ